VFMQCNEGRYTSKRLSCLLPIMYIGTSSSPKEILSILYNPNLNNGTTPSELALTTNAGKSRVIDGWPRSRAPCLLLETRPYMQLVVA
jgi:hypothetical protein